MVVVKREHLYEMIRHAMEGDPNEVCGMLGGRAERVVRVYRVPSVDPSPVRYYMEPREQLRVMQEMESEDLELVGIYHSHTRSAAYPSVTDVNLAYYPVVYFIVSLADPSAPVVRAFRIADGTITEETIEVERDF
ncbi:MAG TPA: M67 family metallopeptidase [Chloroflexota bacterium]